MTSKQRITIVALFSVLLAATAFGAFGVLAQDSENTTPTPVAPIAPEYGRTMQGMMGGTWQSDQSWTAVASALGIDLNTLVTELQSGKTLAQLAEQRGVDVDTVTAAMLTMITDHMYAMVGSGGMTQTQSDSDVRWMHDNMAPMPMFNGMGLNPYMRDGMASNFGQSMMAYGMHSGQVWQNHDGWTGTMHGGCH
jgi:hypothetical protein